MQQFPFLPQFDHTVKFAGNRAFERLIPWTSHLTATSQAVIPD